MKIFKNLNQFMSTMRKRLLSESEDEKEYFNTLIEQQRVDDITIDFFYKPHTLTLLISVICGLLYVAISRTGTTLEEDFYHGGIAVCVVFIFISTLILPNGPFTRPHPAIWRIIFGFSLIYFLLMVYVLFLRLEDVRRILHWFDPKLTNMTHGDILDKDYAVNCSTITAARVYSHLDMFALAHFLGWLVKAILLRHYLISWTLSINWEITEIAFCHILPNFCECWWDSIFLDVIVCNGLGIYVGMKICQWLEMRNYYWESMRHIQSATGKIKRAALQFTPVSWTPTRWLDNHSGVQRGILLSILIIMWQLAELNSFFLKHIFIVKPSHPLTLYRLALVTLMSAPGIRQYYLYVTDPQVNRVGSQLWIFLATISVEMIVCMKFGSEIFEKTMIRYMVYWVIWMIISSFVMVFLSLILANRRKSDEPIIESRSPSQSPPSRPKRMLLKNGVHSPIPETASTAYRRRGFQEKGTSTSTN